MLCVCAEKSVIDKQPNTQEWIYLIREIYQNRHQVLYHSPSHEDASKYLRKHLISAAEFAFKFECRILLFNKPIYNGSTTVRLSSASLSPPPPFVCLSVNSTHQHRYNEAKLNPNRSAQLIKWQKFSIPQSLKWAQEVHFNEICRAKILIWQLKAMDYNDFQTKVTHKQPNCTTQYIQTPHKQCLATWWVGNV